MEAPSNALSSGWAKCLIVHWGCVSLSWLYSLPLYFALYICHFLLRVGANIAGITARIMRSHEIYAYEWYVASHNYQRERHALQKSVRSGFSLRQRHRHQLYIKAWRVFAQSIRTFYCPGDNLGTPLAFALSLCGWLFTGLSWSIEKCFLYRVFLLALGQTSVLFRVCRLTYRRMTGSINSCLVIEFNDFG